MTKLIFWFAFFLLRVWGGNGFVKEQPQMTVTEMIRYWGYPAEEHVVVTEDGYVLTMHRIPFGRNGTQGQPRQPVFLGHSLLTSSAVFSFGPPEKELAYLLADAGYDVWMDNARGNTWSKNHVTFDPCSNCSDFWDFNWDKSAYYDYPAEIDHILTTTSFSNVFFVGYSMGTSRYLALLSLKPEYNDKIRAGFLMGPAAFMGNANASAFNLNSTLSSEEMEDIIHELGMYEFLPSGDLMHYMAHEVCDDEHPLTLILCQNLFFSMFGFSPDKLNNSMISFYLDHMPAGASTQMVFHYAQLHQNAGHFARYDYGPERNLIEYGQPSPPDYDLSQVTAPTALFVGDSDEIACVLDNEILASRLVNLIWHEVVHHPDGWYHTDFFGAIQRKELVYDKIFSLMQEW